MDRRDRSRDRNDDRGDSRSRDRDSGDRRRDRDDDRGSSRGRDRDDDRRGGRRFEYKERDSSSMKKRAEQGGKDFDSYLRDDVNMFKVADGPNFIRILPPTWEEPEHYGMDIYVHYAVGPDKQTYLCLHKMKNERCPICEERAKAQREGDDDYAKKLEPKKRVLTYLLDRNNEKEGVKAWAMPWTMDRDIVKVSVDKRSGEVYHVDDPYDGYDVEFEKSGKGDRTEYSAVSVARRPSTLDNDKALDFVQENPLPSILVYYDYDHIAAAFGGAGSDDHSSRSDREERGRDRDRDSDDHRSSDRSRDRDRDVGRDRDDGGRSSRGRGDSDARDHDTGRDDRRGRDRDDDDALTWDQLHGMNYDELCIVVDEQKLDIDPDKSKSDEDLADWICEELKIKEAPRGRDGGDARDRLASMRGNRER